MPQKKKPTASKSKSTKRPVLRKASKKLPAKFKLLSPKLLIFVLAFVLIGSYFLFSAKATAPNYDNAIADANWMMGSSIPDGPMAGAFATYWDKQHIQPYQANLGSLGLIRATQISGDKTYVSAVWRHLNWYAAHMDGNGYVHDYDLIGGVWTVAPNSVQDKPYDSTDSYAATFLLSIRAAYRVDSDRVKLEALHPAITKAVAAIRSTQQPDGLTWATPDFYQVALLEDNSETYHGLKAAVTLANLLGDTMLANNAQSYADSMQAGIESLWSSSNNYYYWAKHADGYLKPTDWSVLSPDAMEQGWTVAFNIAPSARGASLLNQLDSNQPNWDKPSLNGNNYDVALMGWGYWFQGQKDRAQQIGNNLRSAAITNNRLWPYNFMNAGEIIILQTEGEGLVFDLDPPTGSDTISPNVTIASPPNGASVSNNVSISASATDNVTVTKMEVYIGNKLHATSSTGTINTKWNSRKASSGTHVITVKAYDAAGNVGQSTVSVTK